MNIINKMLTNNKLQLLIYLLIKYILLYNILIINQGLLFSLSKLPKTQKTY